MSKVSPSFLWQIRKLPKYLLDDEVKLFKKFAIVLGAVYIISPVDAMPEIIMPFVGWLDDIGVLGLLLMFLNKELGNYDQEVLKIKGE